MNTIRHKLKQTGETCYWTEIKRRMATQKTITTEAVNALGEKGSCECAAIRRKRQKTSTKN